MKATCNAMANARRLRRDLSLPEQLLWRLLRRQQGQARFRRQHPIGPYVADFYCPKAKLVIEVDGRAHDGQSERDAVRDAYMKSLGLTVMRIAASDVLADPEAVADGLVRLARASDDPPPLSFAERSPSPSLRDREVLHACVSRIAVAVGDPDDLKRPFAHIIPKRPPTTHCRHWLNLPRYLNEMASNRARSGICISRMLAGVRSCEMW